MSVSRWWIAIGLSASLQLLLLYYELHYGTLSGLLQWDDCAIVLRGLENLDRLVHATSAFGFVHAVYSLDVHSPLTDGQTMLGLLISGGRVWGPYLFSATWLTLTLAALLHTFDRRHWLLAIVVVMVVIGQPLTLNALVNIKSDWSGGLLMAGALFLLARGAVTGRQDQKMLGAVLLGLATLSKLTAFYMPIVAAAVLVLFECHSALLKMPGRPGTSWSTLRLAIQSIDRRGLALRLAVGIGPFLLLFIYKWRPTLDYIRGAMSSVWRDGFTVLDRAHFYGPYGPNSWTEWGNLHIFFLVFVLAALLVAWRRKASAYPSALLVLSVIGAMLLVPLLAAPASDHSFASTFLGVVLAATLVALDYLLRTLGGMRCWAIAAVALLISLPVAWPLSNSNYYSRYTISGTELRQLSSTYGRIVDVMVTRSAQGQPGVVVFFDNDFAPHPDLAIGYYQTTGRFPRVARVDDLSDKAWVGQMSDAEFALTFVPSPGQKSGVATWLYPAFPISQDPGRAEYVVRASGRFDSIGVFPVPGGEIHLYGVAPARDPKSPT
jgi:hypothetical protein